MYADDVKLYLEIENDSNVAMLQQNIDKFVKWADMAVVVILSEVLSYAHWSARS